MRVWTLMLIALLAAFGCGNKERTLAVAGGKAVTQAEFDAYLKFKRVSPSDEKRRNQALAEYLERAALAAAIESEGKLDMALLQAELEEFRKEMMISRYFEKFVGDQVSDQAAQNYYGAHAAQYEEKKVHVAHILIRTNPRMSEDERKAKLTTAQEVYSKLQSGQDFAAVADGYSEDKISAKKGGDLGWLREGAIDAAFSKKVFSMKAGEVSEPFETAFGYHVVKVLEAAQVVKRPYGAVAGDIRYQLRAEAKKAEMDRLKAKVVVERKEAYVLPSGSAAASGAPAPSGSSR